MPGCVPLATEIRYGLGQNEYQREFFLRFSPINKYFVTYHYLQSREA
jgi:hypothetical protein